MRRVLRYVFGVVIGLIALATGVYLFLVMRSQPMPAHPFFRLDDPLLVIAHQGGDGERPSNTMLAFQYAVDIGVDVLEMDIDSGSHDGWNRARQRFYAGRTASAGRGL
jgi:glycerophosphoryl diester phosphodiesterase